MSLEPNWVLLSRELRWWVVFIAVAIAVVCGMSKCEVNLTPPPQQTGAQ